VVVVVVVAAVVIDAEKVSRTERCEKIFVS
jgi:hypothetical protein